MHQKARPEPIDLMWIIRHQQYTQVLALLYTVKPLLMTTF